MPSKKPKWYEEHALYYPGAQFAFINHGFYERGQKLPALGEQLERQRVHVGLLLKVLAGFDCRRQRVLEVSCGRGGNCQAISELFSPSKVVGLDASPAHVRLCRRFWKGPKLSFKLGDAEAMPFEDGAFDLVLNIQSSYSYVHVMDFYREVLRVLRPGGTFCYADTFLTPRTAAAITRALSQVGFVLQQQREISDGVATALQSNRRNLENCLLDARADSQAAFDDAVNYLRLTNYTMLAKYRTGKIRFYCWRLEKPGQEPGDR